MNKLKKALNMKRISKNGRFMFLAYDQGIEHGPTDFNDKNVDPSYVIKVAKEGKFTAQIYQKGVAEKYNKEIKKSKVPLIVKLNGKTNLVKGDPISADLCTVEEAIALGAKAVGFTIYIGSIHEEEMMEEFEKILREAHAKGLPVITWIYPRGKGLKGRKKGELLAYATRTGLEIGADIVKVQPTGNLDELRWATRAAGKTKVVIAGGSKKGEDALLKEIYESIDVGCSGVAIGRNVWQSKNPSTVAEKIRGAIWR